MQLSGNTNPKLKYLFLPVLTFSTISFMGCAYDPASPEARERARVVLEETSPRNLNNHPKVTPNFGYKIQPGEKKETLRWRTDRPMDICED